MVRPRCPAARPVVQLLAPFLLQDTVPSSSEPPEKERRRLKESFENYRR